MLKEFFVIEPDPDIGNAALTDNYVVRCVLCDGRPFHGSSANCGRQSKHLKLTHFNGAAHHEVHMKALSSLSPVAKQLVVDAAHNGTKKYPNIVIPATAGEYIMPDAVKVARSYSTCGPLADLLGHHHSSTDSTTPLAAMRLTLHDAVMQ